MVGQIRGCDPQRDPRRPARARRVRRRGGRTSRCRTGGSRDARRRRHRTGARSASRRRRAPPALAARAIARRCATRGVAPGGRRRASCASIAKRRWEYDLPGVLRHARARLLRRRALRARQRRRRSCGWRRWRCRRSWRGRRRATTRAASRGRPLHAGDPRGRVPSGAVERPWPSCRTGRGGMRASWCAPSSVAAACGTRRCASSAPCRRPCRAPSDTSTRGSRAARPAWCRPPPGACSTRRTSVPTPSTSRACTRSRPRSSALAMQDLSLPRGDGRPRVNPHAGSPSAIGLDGVDDVLEAVRQLRGEAVRQVGGARVALVASSPLEPTSAALLGVHDA